MLYSRRVCRGNPKTTTCRFSRMFLTFGCDDSASAEWQRDDRGTAALVRPLGTGGGRRRCSETSGETRQEAGQRETPRLLLHGTHLIEGQLLEVSIDQQRRREHTAET